MVNAIDLLYFSISISVTVGGNERSDLCLFRDRVKFKRKSRDDLKIIKL